MSILRPLGFHIVFNSLPASSFEFKLGPKLIAPVSYKITNLKVSKKNVNRIAIIYVFEFSSKFKSPSQSLGLQLFFSFDSDKKKRKNRLIFM